MRDACGLRRFDEQIGSKGARRYKYIPIQCTCSQPHLNCKLWLHKQAFPFWVQDAGTVFSLLLLVSLQDFYIQEVSDNVTIMSQRCPAALLTVTANVKPSNSSNQQTLQTFFFKDFIHLTSRGAAAAVARWMTVLCRLKMLLFGFAPLKCKQVITKHWWFESGIIANYNQLTAENDHSSTWNTHYRCLNNVIVEFTIFKK